MCSTAVTFYKQGHKYECDNEQYLSVTRFVDMFKERFDEDAWSWYLAVKLYYIGDFIDKKTGQLYLNDETVTNHYPIQLWNDYKQGKEKHFIVSGTLQKEYLYKFVEKFKYPQDLIDLKLKVLAKWHNKKVRASEGGSAYHDMKERETLFEMFGYVPQESRAEVEKKVAKDLVTLTDGPQPELMIYYHKYKIVGQSDLPIIRTKGKVRYCQIRDYKTNEDGIKEPDYFSKPYNYPIQHIKESKFTHYALQLSVYMWMMEQAGYICDGLYLDWAKIDFETGEVLEEKEIEVPYLKAEVEAMMKYHFKKEKASTGRVRIETKF